MLPGLIYKRIVEKKYKITSSRKSRFWFIGILIILTMVFFALDILLGSVRIPLRDILKMFSGTYTEHAGWKLIIFEFRIPRAFTALLAGTALSISGLQMQTIFRNPLAGPYVLGISSGASLGVAILMMGFSSVWMTGAIGYAGNWALVLSAIFGSGMILMLILAVSIRIKDIMTILILGILFGSVATALVAVLQYFSHESMLKSFIVWTMGSLGNVSHNQLRALTIMVVLGILISFGSVKILNAMLLGEDYARTLGLNVKIVRAVVFISTSILAGTVTAFCGPIGFIGIVVPHLARLLFHTADHKILVPGSFLIGAIFMLVSDILSQVPGYDHILPINSVTALMGIPVIIWIIIRKKEIAPLS